MPIHPELNALLDWAWGQRIAIMQAGLRSGGTKGSTNQDMKKQGKNYRVWNGGIAMIYKKYNEVPAGAANAAEIEAQDIEKFFSTLSILPFLLPGMNLQLQIGTTFYSKTMAEVQATENMLDLKGAFVHFKKPRSGCSYRVYLNLPVATRALTFAAIIDKVWPIPGVLSGKVSVPGRPRSDSALIYCLDRAAQQAVVAEITAIYQQARQNFGQTLPKLVDHVPGTSGVGTSMEPPQLHLMPEGDANNEDFYAVRSAQSFGTYRATLIYTALERSQFPEEGRMGRMRHGRQVDGQLKEAFKARVGAYFQKGGISMTNPSQQVAPEDYISIDGIIHQLGGAGANAGRPRI